MKIDSALTQMDIRFIHLATGLLLFHGDKLLHCKCPQKKMLNLTSNSHSIDINLVAGNLIFHSRCGMNLE